MSLINKIDHAKVLNLTEQIPLMMIKLIAGHWFNGMI